MFDFLAFRYCWFLLLFLPDFAAAQVFNTSNSLQRGSFAISASPVVQMKDGSNVLAMYVYGSYGIGRGIDLHVKTGFFEGDNYVGGNLEWTIRRTSPFISLSAGAQYVTDPGVDGTLNLTFPMQNGFEIYLGLDTDLILDDDPDLPAWVFLGGAYNLINQVDIMAEFNYGIFEIAPHILAAGFVFYF